MFGCWWCWEVPVFPPVTFLSFVTTVWFQVMHIVYQSQIQVVLGLSHMQFFKNFEQSTFFSPLNFSLLVFETLF